MYKVFHDFLFVHQKDVFLELKFQLVTLPLLRSTNAILEHGHFRGLVSYKVHLEHLLVMLHS